MFILYLAYITLYIHFFASHGENVKWSDGEAQLQGDGVFQSHMSVARELSVEMWTEIDRERDKASDDDRECGEGERDREAQETGRRQRTRDWLFNPDPVKHSSQSIIILVTPDQNA